MAWRNGRILCLIVGAGNTRDVCASDEVYRDVLRGIDALAGLDSESASPVKLGSLRFGVIWNALEKEARSGSGPPWRRRAGETAIVRIPRAARDHPGRAGRAPRASWGLKPPRGRPRTSV